MLLQVPLLLLFLHAYRTTWEVGNLRKWALAWCCWEVRRMELNFLSSLFNFFLFRFSITFRRSWFWKKNMKTNELLWLKSEFNLLILFFFPLPHNCLWYIYVKSPLNSKAKAKWVTVNLVISILLTLLITCDLENLWKTHLNIRPFALISC